MKGLIFYNVFPPSRALFCPPFHILQYGRAQCLHICWKKRILFDWKANLKCQLFLCKWSYSFSCLKRLGAQMGACVYVCMWVYTSLPPKTYSTIPSPLQLLIYTSQGRKLTYKDSRHNGTTIFACTLSTLNAKQIINWEYNAKTVTKAEKCKSAPKTFNNTLTRFYVVM